MQLYVDGALVAGDATVTSALANTGYWRIGYDSLTAWPQAPTSSFLAATVDRAAVFTSALSATQIAAHYNAA